MTLPLTNQTALLLPGGGARAAYQVGVLKGIAALIGPVERNPFPIVCGTSAGALNAVALATKADDFTNAVRWLEELWMQLAIDNVYRTDWQGIMRNALRLVLSLINTGAAVGAPVALLDNTPLRELLGKELDFDSIGRHIKNGHLGAVCVTAMNYTLSCSMSFFQGGPDHANWQRWRRRGMAEPLQLTHLMASTAIPTIFPPERIGDNYFGDGALRQLTPISPALHLGASRVLIVPPSGHLRNYNKPVLRHESPAFGQIIGHLLNSAFMDSLESDIELLERVNEMLKLLPPEQRSQLSRKLEPIDLHVISPSQDIDVIADAHMHELPRTVRRFLRVTGSGHNSGGVNAASYLLFTRPFIEKLIALGCADVLSGKEKILEFMRGGVSAPANLPNAAQV